MNKLSHLIFITILLASTTTAIAQDSHDNPGGPGAHHARGMQGMPAVEQLIRALHRLDLDENQQENIHTALRDLQADARPIMQATKARHQQLRQLITADVYDENAVAALATTEGELAAERVVLTSRTLANIFSMLSDEQRSQLRSMAEQRQQHRSERRKHKRRSS